MSFERILSSFQEDKSKGFTSNTLKTYAMIAMMLEHIARAFVPTSSPFYYVMMFIGKSSAPLFFFFIVEGYHHTRNKNRYTLNLALFAIISYFPYIWCFDGALNAETYLNLNVIYTLLLGLLVIRARHEIKNKIFKCCAIAILFILSVIGDWGWIALLTILTFDVFYVDTKKQAYAFALIALLKWNGLLGNLIMPFTMLLHYKQLDFSSWSMLWPDMGMLISAILICFYNGQKGRGGKAMKWGFYIFYPLHLAIIAAIKMFV